MQLANETAPRALGLDFGTTNTVLSWVEAGNELVSIANGLATIGLREDVDAWSVAPAAERAPARRAAR